MSYIVYKHTNKANGKVYIGITKQNAERRWQNGYGYRGTYFWNAIEKYGWDGFMHEVLLRDLTKQQACDAEKRLIAEYDTMNREHGYNICEGGQTGDNLIPHFGKENNRAVSVRRIDPKTGNAVVFETVTQAAETMGINHRGISKNCRGVSATYMGYVWEYVDISIDKPPHNGAGNYEHAKQRKPIKMTDADGRTYRFESIKDAAAHIGTKATTVSRYLNGLRKDPIGRRWSLCL